MEEQRLLKEGSQLQAGVRAWRGSGKLGDASIEPMVEKVEGARGKPHQGQAGCERDSHAHIKALWAFFLFF